MRCREYRNSAAAAPPSIRRRRRGSRRMARAGARHRAYARCILLNPGLLRHELPHRFRDRPRAARPVVAARRQPARAAQPAAAGAGDRAACGWRSVRPAAAGPDTALVLDIAGPVVEQRSGGLRDSALGQLRGDDHGGTRLRDVLAVLDAAAKDDHDQHALLMLDDMAGAGLPTLREIAAAIERFKAAGKPVYAWGSSYDQRQYFLAAHATEVWLHPMGMVRDRGLRPLAQLLPGPARPRGRHRQRAARGQVQELRRDLLRQRAVAGDAGGRDCAVRRAVGRATPAASRRRASCPPAASRRPSTRCPAA